MLHVQLYDSNNYMMEVVNKLKLLEVDVENSHKEPIDITKYVNNYIF